MALVENENRSGAMKTKDHGMASETPLLATRVGRWVVKSWCVVAGVLLSLAATSVTAQQPGDTVRVSGALVGVLVEADSAGLLLSSGYAPYAGMQSLEVWGGTRGQAGSMFKKGFAAGAILGGVVGMGICYGLGCNDSDYPVIGLMYGTGAGLLVGGLGALIGSGVRSDIWVPVPIPGGISLRLAVGGR